MRNKDVRELYKIIPHGTTVTIVQNVKKFRALRNGDTGSDVVDLQKALKKVGYYKGSSDGRFGSGLESCVKKFQKDNKFKVTGIVDRNTYNLLMSKCNPEDAKEAS